MVNVRLSETMMGVVIFPVRLTFSGLGFLEPKMTMQKAKKDCEIFGTAKNEKEEKKNRTKQP